MLPGPVFNVELLTTARRPRYYAMRVIYGLALLVLIWQNYTQWDRYGGAYLAHQRMTQFARSTFVSMLVLQAVGVATITPALCAGVIANEKQRKTLHYLLASRLTSPEIVLGKLMARMLHVAVILAAGLPVMTMLGLFGGVDPLEAMLGFGGCLTGAFFLASLAVLCSTVAKRVREAISAAYALEAAWLFLPVLVRATMPTYNSELYHDWVQPVNDWIIASTPWWPMMNAPLFFLGRGQNALLVGTLTMMALQVGAGLIFTALAVWRLRPVFRSQEGARAFRFLGIPLPGRKTGRVRLFGRRPVMDRAMVWKELFTSRTSGAAQIVGLGISLVIAMSIGYWVLYFLPDAWREFVSGPYDTLGGATYSWIGAGVFARRSEFSLFLRWITSAIEVISILGVGVAAANNVTSEREDDTWISLIATPMDGREIVGAKMAGVIWKTRWAMLGVAVLWVLGLATGSIHPIGVLFQAVSLAVYLAFASALGTRLSLHSKSSWRAQTSTIAILVFVGGGYLACCCPMMIGGRETALYLGACIPLDLFASLVSPWEFSDIFLQGKNVNFGPRDRVGELVVALFLGVIAYAGAAAALGASAIAGFDRAADRPRREEFVPRQPATPPKDLPPADLA